MFSAMPPITIGAVAARGAAVVATLALALVFASSAAAAIVTNERRSFDFEDFDECTGEPIAWEAVLHTVVRDNGEHHTLVGHGEGASGTRYVIANVGNTSRDVDGEAADHTTERFQIHFLRQGNDYAEDDWTQQGLLHATWNASGEPSAGHVRGTTECR